MSLDLGSLRGGRSDSARATLDFAIQVDLHDLHSTV
jgi:hypothetical protein